MHIFQYDINYPINSFNRVWEKVSINSDAHVKYDNNHEVNWRKNLKEYEKVIIMTI